MGKGFMLFGGERLISNFEEDMHVLKLVGSRVIVSVSDGFKTVGSLCLNCFSVCQSPIDLSLISQTANAFCAVCVI